MMRAQKQSTILHIDMDAFFVSVERLLNPKLKGKPVIVGGAVESRGVVSAASYEAREYGVHSAMPMAVAKRRCPGAIFLSGSQHAYANYSERVMAILSRYTPRLQQVSVDEANLDLTGCERMHHAPPFDIAIRIHGDIGRELQLPCSIGLAGGKVVAKIAANLAKRNGLLQVLPGYEAPFLAPLPISRMPGVGPVAQKEYRKMGVRTLGDLAAIDPKTLERTFGKWAHRAVTRARGEERSGVEERAPAKSIGKEVTYSVDSDDRAYLEATLSYLSEKVARRMRTAGFHYRRVTLKLRYADFNTYTRSRILQSEKNDAASIFTVARELLRQLELGRGGKKRVRLVGVTVSSLTAPERQISLFDTGEKKKKNDRLGLRIDTIRDRHGFDAIMTAHSYLYKKM